MHLTYALRFRHEREETQICEIRNTPSKQVLAMMQTDHPVIRMAVVQAAAIPGGPQQNLKTLHTFSEKAAAAGCSAVCFPEGFLTGYDPDNAAKCAISADDPVLKEVSWIAAALQIDILAGYMERRIPSKEIDSENFRENSSEFSEELVREPFKHSKGHANNTSNYSIDPAELHSNTSLLPDRSKPSFAITHAVFYPDGRVLPCRKTHLGEKEQTVFEPGNMLQVFPLSCGVTAALQICVECHFPEITQVLSLQGAQVIFAPFASPGTPEDRRRIWQTIIPARAYDNRVVMACCNLLRMASATSTSPESVSNIFFGSSALPKNNDCGKPGLPGGCFICGPEGEVLAEDFGGSPGLCIFDVDPAQLALYRTPQPSMRYRYFTAKRRPELYAAQQPVAFLFPQDSI